MKLPPFTPLAARHGFACCLFNTENCCKFILLRCTAAAVDAALQQLLPALPAPAAQRSGPEPPLLLPSLAHAVLLPLQAFPLAAC
jgi:hypothetical protein